MQNNENYGGIDDKLIKETALTYLSLVLMVMVSVVFIYPRFDDLKISRYAMSTMQTKIDNLNKSLAALDEFREKVGKSGQDVLYQAIPVNFEPGVILSNLRLLSTKANVNISEYSLNGGLVQNDGSKPVVRKGVSSSRLKIKVAGTPQSLLGFMKLVESSLPLGDIVEVSISEIARFMNEEVQDNVVNLTLTIEYYYLPMTDSGATDLSSSFINENEMSLLGQLFSHKPKGLVEKRSETF